jgi:hypothetical protein
VAAAAEAEVAVAPVVAAEVAVAAAPVVAAVLPPQLLRRHQFSPLQLLRPVSRPAAVVVEVVVVAAVAAAGQAISRPHEPAGFVDHFRATIIDGNSAWPG